MERFYYNCDTMGHYLNYLLLAIVLLCGGGLLRAQEVQVCDVKNPAVGYDLVYGGLQP